MGWFKRALKAGADMAIDAGKKQWGTVQEALDLSRQWADKDKNFIEDKRIRGTKVERMAANKVAKDRGWKA